MLRFWLEMLFVPLLVVMFGELLQFSWSKWYLLWPLNLGRYDHLISQICILQSVWAWHNLVWQYRIAFCYTRGSQLFFLAGHKGPNIVQRSMSGGQMITTVLCISMYIGVDKGPSKYGLWARFGPRAAIWEGLCYTFVKFNVLSILRLHSRFCTMKNILI